MRPFTSRLFPNTVTVIALVVGQDRAGGRTKDWPLGVDWIASVQPGSAARKGETQGATRSEVLATAFFQSDPGVKVDDRVAWGARIFSVLGPATAEAGRNTLYSVQLVEIK